MENTNTYSHLTLEEYRIILKGITNGSTKTAIAQTIGKDKSTIGKEIKAHRVLVKKYPLPPECSAYRKCHFDRQCTPDCPDYTSFRCSQRDRSPGAYNGCANRSKCRFGKYEYNPEKAQTIYQETLQNSRAGVNLTSAEVKAMADIISPLLRQGLSPYQILQAHPELNVCKKIIYNYIESDVFHEVADITVSWPCTERFPGSPRRTGLSPARSGRTGATCRGVPTGTTCAYLTECPDAFVTQMDTVYNDESSGPFIQTFKFVKSDLFFALLHQEKTTSVMLSSV